MIEAAADPLAPSVTSKHRPFRWWFALACSIIDAHLTWGAAPPAAMRELVSARRTP